MIEEKLNNNIEYIEEWDWEKAVPAGRAVARHKAHKEGIAHEGVHLWVLRLTDKPEILFQHRAKTKDMYPDCLDITVGGHVPFGIKENKIQKESFEEIGISPRNDELIDLGYYRYEEIADELYHREFQHVFLCVDNRPLNQYNFTDGEVDGIFAVRLKDLELLMQSDISFPIEGYEEKSLIEREVSRKDFHPLLFAESMKEYMKVIIQACKEIAVNGSVSTRMPDL
ncbi:MAG: NUDIX domain-containing protein [Spirochaetes bacterium]|nr:NUDIX domain-containing protein [Spirochaetota bacterium]